MAIHLINNSSPLHPVTKELESIGNEWTEVIIRPANGKPSKAMIAAYWAKLRLVANDQGLDIKEAHSASMEFSGCVFEQGGNKVELNPFDFEPKQFHDYFKSVMWQWQTMVSIDLGMI